ncbi:hypothetical protein CR513_18547, partial [Mucuna pruriens]
MAYPIKLTHTCLCKTKEIEGNIEMGGFDENQVRSEKWQPASNDLAMDWDPMELEYQLSYPEGQFVSNEEGTMSDKGRHVRSESNQSENIFTVKILHGIRAMVARGDDANDLYRKPANFWKRKFQCDSCANAAIVKENQEFSINLDSVLSKEQLKHLYKLFQSPKLSLNPSSNKKVKIVDGSLSAIKLTPLITLHNVHHVPNLSCNLLSISKITPNHQCQVNFYSYCVFQELTIGRIIDNLSKQCPNTCLNSTFVSQYDDIMLRHYRSSFSLRCEKFQFVKYHRTSFPSQMYKPIAPFIVIHSDKQFSLIFTSWFKPNFKKIFTYYEVIMGENISILLKLYFFYIKYQHIFRVKLCLLLHTSNKILNFDTPLYELHKRFSTDRLSSFLPLKIFACTAFVHIYNHNRGKLEPRAKKCVLLDIFQTKRDLNGCKKVFTSKYKSDGSLERYKVRLIVKGFTQTYGIDYSETFVLIAKLNSIKVLLSLATNLNWPLQCIPQWRFRRRGVYGTLGFGEKFGTKSPKVWFEKFTKFVKSQGFNQGQGDHTMFFKHSQDKKISILIIYVDDIILTRDDVFEINCLKNSISTTFEIKDLGTLGYFLAMEVARSKTRIMVSQRKYILDLLKET